MTDETPAGVAPVEPVAPTSATPQTATSPQPVSGTDIESVIDARLEKFAEGLAKRLKQSQRDIVEDRLTKALDKHFGKPAASAPAPETPASPAPPQATPAAAVTATSGFESEIKAILDERGLTGQEPELQEFAQANKGQPWYKVGPQLDELAAKIAARRGGSPSGVVVPPGPKPNEPELAAQYLEDIAAARKAGRFGAGNLRAIKDKYRKLGLAVENVRLEIDGVRVPARGKTEDLR